MKIILADTHGPILGKAQGSPNLGLLYLASYAKQEIDNITFHYIPQKYGLNHHIHAVKKLKPRFYAISFTSYGANKAFEVINILKEKLPQLTVICGGPHASAVPHDVLEKCLADIVVIGEGEETFVDIIKNENRLEEALPSINGVAYLDNGMFRKTPTRQLIVNIDELPLPARELTADEDFVGIQFCRATPNTEMIITRGCPFRCVFCANPVFRVDGGPLVRKRSPQAIAEEAENLYQKGYREIYLHSDELNVSHNWSIEVCKQLAALGHDDLLFQCHLRAAPVSEELAFWLKKANFWLVRFGIESSSERVLEGIKKQMSNERTDLACKIMSDAGINVLGYFTMYQFWEDDQGNLQVESTEEVLDTIKYAKMLWKKGWLHYTTWMVAMPVQGAELYDVAKRHDLVTSDYIPGDNWISSQYLPGISYRNFGKTLRAGRILQGRMALKNGSINLRNWQGLLTKFKDIVMARKQWLDPRGKQSRT